MGRVKLSAVVVLCFLLGCSSDSAVSGWPWDDGPPPQALWVNCRGQHVAGELTVSVSLRLDNIDGVTVPDAVVGMNGQNIAYDSLHATYIGTVGGLLPGDTITLSIRYAPGSAYVTASLALPDPPVIVSPVPAGSPYDATAAIGVEWLPLSPAPDQVSVSVGEERHLTGTGVSGSGHGWYAILDGSLTTVDIPAGEFLTSERQLPDTDTDIIISATNRIDRWDDEAELTMTVGHPVLGSFTTHD